MNEEAFLSACESGHLAVAQWLSNFGTFARKDLIINDGVKRHAQPLLKVFADSWPTYSPYVCWVDCHPFDSTPVGIPHMLVGNEFHCYGNLCSYNCAMRNLCP